MSVYRGNCHCGAVGFEYRTEKPVGEWFVRSCECSFCRKHGAIYTSDPAGSTRFVHKDVSALSRYRFGHKTADFVFCGRCGSPLYSRRDSMPDVVRLRLGTLDSPIPGRPTEHIFTAEKADWFQICDDLPQHAVLP